MKARSMRVGIVSIYPPLGCRHSRHGGVASYTKNLVSSLSRSTESIVLADKLEHKKDNYVDDGAMVIRCWDKGILYPFQIFRNILRNKIDVVHAQHEIFLYGNLHSALVFPFLLLSVAILRTPRLVTLHGVISPSDIDEKFLRENDLKGNGRVLRIGLIFLVKVIVMLSDLIIVHEEKFKETLTREYGCPIGKVHVVPHGIERKKDLVEKEKAKRRLRVAGKSLILFFGYITGYKNVELLIQSAKFIRLPDWKIVIAGGPHPRLKQNPDYREYLISLREEAFAVAKDRILFTGFVNEKDISWYFSAADLAIFPYTTSISSSGPMCLAISYRLPFLVSEDFDQLGGNGDLTFKLDPNDLARKVEDFFAQPKLRLRAFDYIEKLAEERPWKKVGQKTEDIYNVILRDSQPKRPSQ